MIEIKNLCIEYDGKKALNDISLNFDEGRLTVLTAPNGGGKSTLLKAAAGLQEMKSGSIRIDGREIGDWSRTELARRVAYMSQNRNTPNIQAKKMVLHGRFPYLSYPRKYRKEDYEAAAEALRQTDAEELANRFVPELSGGQRQRIYLAMTLAQGTDAIFLDEPLNFLDVKHQTGLLKLARRLADEGKTVVLVIHDIRLALQEADTIAVLQDGKLIASGTPEEVYASGTIQKVFEVDIDFVMTESGRRYFYR